VCGGHPTPHGRSPTVGKPVNPPEQGPSGPRRQPIRDGPSLGLRSDGHEHTPVPNSRNDLGGHPVRPEPTPPVQLGRPHAPTPFLIRRRPGKPSGGRDVGVHKTRADGTDPNSVTSKLAGKALSKHEHGGLGGAVGRQGWEWKKPSSGGGHDNVPTLPTRDKRRNKRAKGVDNPPEIDVDNTPPVAFGGVEKGPGNTNPGVGHDKVGYSVFGKDMIGKPPRGGAVGNVKLKCTTANFGGRPRSGAEVDINTKHLNTLPSEGESGGPPNPTAGAGDERKPPSHGKRRFADPSPRQLPRSGRPVKMIDELKDKPSNIRRLMPNSPVLTNKRPPPKPRTPPVGGGKKCRSNKRIPSKRDLLNRNGNPPSLRPPPHHIGPIKLNPIPSI
jgi:hypothetical protein